MSDLRQLKTVYMGTPDFAVPALKALHRLGVEIGYVVTQPDKAKGRGKKVQYTPVKEAALELGLQVLQPEKVKGNADFIKQLQDYGPELIVVAAYGQILPKEIIHMPEHGCINIHASLLPRWRGAAPMQRAIMEGDHYTGVTLMYMEEGLDPGDMLVKAQTEVAGKTTEVLHDELAEMGAGLLSENLEKLVQGELSREKQDDSQATYAHMIFKKDGELDFTKSATQLERLVRAMDSWPGAYTCYRGEVMKVWESKISQGNPERKPGEILSVKDEGILVNCKEGALLITSLQMPGKKRMLVSQYLRGNSVEEGIVLGGE